MTLFPPSTELRAARFLGLFLYCASGLGLVYGQGSLVPSGPPGPTMKTLTQIEPRIPIEGLPFTISSSGSYYLTGDLKGEAGQDGIKITASDVTLDLNGYSLIGAPEAGVGILLSGETKNVSVLNGRISSWSAGIGALTASSCRFESLTLSKNAGHGLALGGNNLLLNCVSVLNGGSGFQVAAGCELKDCSAKQNGQQGFAGLNSVTLSRCTANSNGAHGVFLADGARLEDCRAHSNIGAGVLLGADALLLECDSVSNGGEGILAGSDARLEGCTAAKNGLAGILVGQNSTIRKAKVNGNGASTPGEGISCGTGSVIEESNASGNNGVGIRLADYGAVKDSSVYANSGAGIYTGNGCQIVQCTAARHTGIGIHAADQNQLIDCQVSGNGVGIKTGSGAQVQKCSAQGNGSGIQVDSGSSVRHCTAAQNSANGITVASECTVIGNDSNNNFNARDASGIHALGTDNCIRENNVVSNDRGISATAAGNLILRNTASNNTLNFFLTGSQTFGPLLIGTNTVEALNPWTNFSF